jgi:hypothetical protein
MKADPIIEEVERVKDRLSEQAGDLVQFLNDMDAWLQSHPHSGPVVNSPEELETRVRHREATEKPLPPAEPYRIYDPIIAEVHRTREQPYRERKETAYALREEPQKKK